MKVHFYINTSPFMSAACGDEVSDQLTMVPNGVTCEACHDTPIFEALLDYWRQDDLDSPGAEAAMARYHQLCEEMSK